MVTNKTTFSTNKIKNIPSKTDISQKKKKKSKLDVSPNFKFLNLFFKLFSSIIFLKKILKRASGENGIFHF